MIPFTPPRWQALKEQWAELPRDDSTIALYWHLDGDGYVRVRTLLFGNIVVWASEIMETDLRRDHTYRADYTQRMRDER